MRFLLLPLIAISVVPGLSAQTAAAPEKPAAKAASEIGGFLTLQWGAKLPEVKASYPNPMMDQTTPDSSHVIVYKEDVLGKPVLALFYVDAQKGLVKGVYSAPYDSVGADCEVVFEKFGTFVRRLYPTLTGTQEKKPNREGAAFCATADSGKASRSALWKDALGNSVRVALDPSANHVDVVFQSKDFKELPVPPAQPQPGSTARSPR